jgi:assimilatory nitrate reductase catalytic subunit
MLDESGGVQWPLGEGETPVQERRLFHDGLFFHADKRARFVFDEPRPMPEPADAAFPFLLLTGRGTSAQWHTQTRTAKSDVLRKLSPAAAYIEINPQDAERLGVSANSKVVICSRRGEVTAVAVLTPTVQPGQVFMPMHFAITNRLTASVVDPYSRQPSYKVCSVALRRSTGRG